MAASLVSVYGPVALQAKDQVVSEASPASCTDAALSCTGLLEVQLECQLNMCQKHPEDC